jgi:hypothetical protein
MEKEYYYISIKEFSNEPGNTVIINDVGAMALDKASTRVFDSVGGVLAECEAAVSGNAASTHVASVADAVGGSEHSAIMLLQASAASTQLASTTSAITRNSSNILAVADPVGGSEHSAITLLQASSDAFKFTAASAMATSTAITKLNEVVEPPNHGQNNKVGNHGSMESSSTNNPKLP